MAKFLKFGCQQCQWEFTLSSGQLKTQFESSPKSNPVDSQEINRFFDGIKNHRRDCRGMIVLTSWGFTD